jgi:hypothetical protein
VIDEQENGLGFAARLGDEKFCLLPQFFLMARQPDSIGRLGQRLGKSSGAICEFAECFGLGEKGRAQRYLPWTRL